MHTHTHIYIYIFEMVTFVHKCADDLLTLKANSNGRKLADFLRQIEEEINGHLTTHCKGPSIRLCFVSFHGSRIGGPCPWGLQNIGF